MDNLLTSLKLPPHSTDAETALLAAVLERNSLIDDLEDILSAEYFYRREHQIIFGRMKDLSLMSQPIDPATLVNALDAEGELRDAGGVEYLADIATCGRGAHNAKNYAQIVRDRWLQRQLIAKGYRIAELGYDAPKAQDAIQEAQALIMDFDHSPAGEVTDLNQQLRAMIDKIDDLMKNRGQIIGLTTGLTDLDKRLSGLQSGDLVIVAGRPSMGKELHNNAKVLMINGKYKRIGDVMVGDMVASVDGKPSKIFGVFPQGEKQVYRVTFSDGRSVMAGLEHQWEVMYRDWISPRILTTEKIISMLACKRYKGRLFIEKPSGDFGADERIKIHPYLLGVILGDGGISAGSVIVSNSDAHIIDKVRHLAGGLSVNKIRKDLQDYRIVGKSGRGNWLTEALREYGLFGLLSSQKFIPENYLSASKETRRQLFMGMVDTDGTVEKFGAMTYSTSSERMAEEFLSLARSLGFWAKVSSRIPAYSYLGEKLFGKRSYRISLQRENMEDFISLPRKRDRLFSKKTTRRKNLNFESITPEGVADCTCISVTHPRELFICDDYIVTHNTTLAMNFSERAALDGKNVLVFSLEMPAQQLLMRSSCSIGKFSHDKLRRGDLDDHELSGLTSAVARLKGKSLSIDDRPALTSEQALSRARKVVRKSGKPLDLIVVDYIQLMSDKGEELARITNITRNLKLLAKSMDCPVVALSQLNRECDKRPNKRPLMSDLRSSGSIEQDADVIMFVYRDEVYNTNSDQKGIAEVNVAKFRNGEIGTVFLASRLDQCRFDNLSNYTPPSQPTKRTRGGFDYE